AKRGAILLLSILYPFAKLKMPLRATALCVRGSAQSPVVAEAAPTSRPRRKHKAQRFVTRCPWSRGTLLGLLPSGSRSAGIPVAFHVALILWEGNHETVESRDDLHRQPSALVRSSPAHAGAACWRWMRTRFRRHGR